MKKFYCVLTAIVVMMMFVGCPDAVNGENEGKNNGAAGNVSVPSYTIIFSANGGYGVMSNMVCKIGQSYDVPECGFRRDGYVFYGWDGLKFRPKDWSQDDYGFIARNRIYNLSETDGDIVVLSAQWMKKWSLDESGDFVTGDGKVLSKTGMVQVLSATTGFICDKEEGAFITERNRIVLKKYALGKYEVTNELYYAVMNDDPVSKYYVGEYSLSRVGTDWYKAIIFCNRLSLLMGKTPCYSLDGVTEWGRAAIPTMVDYSDIVNKPQYYEREKYGDAFESYKAAFNNWMTNIKCDWTADGYRLPTELEWECAARGGVYSDNTADPWNYTYSGSNNYYDAVESPNTLGIYEMNSSAEMCWDLWGRIDENTPVTGNTSYVSDSDGDGYSNVFMDSNGEIQYVRHTIKGGEISGRWGGDVSEGGIRLACIGE